MSEVSRKGFGSGLSILKLENYSNVSKRLPGAGRRLRDAPSRPEHLLSGLKGHCITDKGLLQEAQCRFFSGGVTSFKDSG